MKGDNYFVVGRVVVCKNMFPTRVALLGSVTFLCRYGLVEGCHCGCKRWVLIYAQAMGVARSTSCCL